MSTDTLPPERAGRLRGFAGLVLLVAAAAIIWWGLDRAERRPDWLGVEAPRRAFAGQPFPVRVHLAPLAEPGVLCADLHWGATRDTPMRYLATGGSKPVGREGGTLDFEIVVPPREGMGFVAGVIYLGPTGSWGDHKLAAATELVPVVSGPAKSGETRLEPLGLQRSGESSPSHPPPRYGPRLLTGLVFLAAMMVAWYPGPPAKASDGRPSPENRWWQALVVLLALACVWELFGLERLLGDRARAIARARDLYHLRIVLQKAVISIAVAAAVLSLPFIRRVRRSHRLALVAFALYLAIAAVNLVSLHAVDQVADLSWHGVSLVQALKLGCAVMTLEGVRRMRRTG